jgi:hypothetical protein
MGLIRRAWLPREEIVTGERLQALATVSIVPPGPRSFHRHLERHVADPVYLDDYQRLDNALIERLSGSRSLFVYTHELEDFQLHVWPRLSGDGYVLITHNSDHEVGLDQIAWLDAQGQKLRHWFAQNALADHPKLTPLPIAVANSMWPHGNLRLLHRAIARSSRRRPTELVYLQFNPRTHPGRLRAWEALKEHFPGLGGESAPSIAYRRYLAEMMRHRFCVAPRGNGADTHRFWECQYLGVVPITERSSHTEHWRRQGLPAVLVDDWAEVTPQRLHEESERLAGQRPNREPLLLSTYRRLVKAAESS